MDLCSILLHAHPDRLGAVQSALGTLEGVEIHALEPDGCMVITVEGDDPDGFSETVLGIEAMEGVIDASLVYHYHDDEHDG